MLYHKKGKETYSFGVISWLLIRRLIQLHKGKILFCSNKNKKASVILTFPIVFRKRKSREAFYPVGGRKSRIQFILNTGVIRRIQCLYGI